MYIDPAREPVHFLLSLLERGPVLLLGQYLAPPAEFYVLGGPEVARWILVGAVLFVLVLAVALVPLLAREATARFWCAGMLLSLVPAASAYPHNRQLLLVSFGALGLIAQFWQRHAIELKGERVPRWTAFSGGVGALLLFAHLIFSPLVLPLTTCSIAFSAPLHRGIEAVGDEIAGRDVVFLNAPDYFAVKLVQLSRRVERAPLPRRWRALAFGPEPIVVERTDARTLTLEVEGGILSDPLLELYRDRRSPTPPGYRVALEGLEIEVLEATADGRARRIAFVFDTPLDEDRFRFYAWQESLGFVPLVPPRVGAAHTLPPARLEWGL
jgi:hypothetical protein